MNYLTEYYKNLCEQLQKRINMLEAEIRSPDQIREIGQEKYNDAVQALKAKKGGELSSEEYEQIAREVYGPYTARSVKRQQLLATAASQLRDVAASGDVETAEQFGDVMADVNRSLYTGKVAGLSNLDPSDRTRLKNLEQHTRELSQENRKRGIATNVPADTAAMRKVVAMGTGRYQPPYPQPEGPVNGMHVTPQQY